MYMYVEVLQLDGATHGGHSVCTLVLQLYQELTKIKVLTSSAAPLTAVAGGLFTAQLLFCNFLTNICFMALPLLHM